MCVHYKYFILTCQLSLLFLPPANKVCEGYVFTGVCLSTFGGLYHGDPRTVTCGRYASYWNAFLFQQKLHFPVNKFWMKIIGHVWKEMIICLKVCGLSHTATTSYAHQPIHRKDGWTLTKKSSITSRPWHDVFRWRPSSPRHSSHNYKRKPCYHGMASWTRRTNAVGVDTESAIQVSNGHLVPPPSVTTTGWLIRVLRLHLEPRKHISLPPANEVCEGYVFTGVCLSTGECLPLVPGRGCLSHPHPLGSACWDKHMLWPLHAGIQTPPAQCMLGYTPLPSACWDTVNKRAVRIPLECILVPHNSSPMVKE